MLHLMYMYKYLKAKCGSKYSKQNEKNTSFTQHTFNFVSKSRNDLGGAHRGGSHLLVISHFSVGYWSLRSRTRLLQGVWSRKFDVRYRGVKGQRKENTDGNTLFGVNLNASFAAYRTKVEETQEYGGRFWPGKWGMDSHMMLSSAASSASVTGAFGVTRLQFVVVFTGLKMTRRQLKRPFSHLLHSLNQQIRIA